MTHHLLKYSLAQVLLGLQGFSWDLYLRGKHNCNDH